MNKRNSRKAEQPDRGAGYVTITLDHGSGSARLGYDNLTPEELGALAALLQQHAADLLRCQDREHIRAEVEQELRARAGGRKGEGNG